MNSVPFIAALRSWGHTGASTQREHGLSQTLPPWSTQTFLHGRCPMVQLLPYILPACMEWNPNTWFGITNWQAGMGCLVSTSIWSKLVKQPWSLLEISHGLEPRYTRQTPPLTEPVAMQHRREAWALGHINKGPVRGAGRLAWICSQTPSSAELELYSPSSLINWSCFNKGCWSVFALFLQTCIWPMESVNVVPLFPFFLVLVHLTHIEMKCVALFPQFTWLLWTKENMKAKMGHKSHYLG